MASVVATNFIEPVASKLNERVGIAISYTVFGEEKVRELTFKGFRVAGSKIRELFADNAVSKLCICAANEDVGDVQRIIVELASSRKHERTGKNLVNSGRAWFMEFNKE